MSKTILLADDSITIQKVIELTFMDQDCEVVAVGTGDEAVAQLDGMAPDLVIADVHMPGASGYEVARQSKERHPGVPVLLLVGTFEPFDEKEMAASGADSHLKKPFDSQELLQLVERLMESAEEAGGESAESAAEPAAEAVPAPGPRPVPPPPAAEPPPAEPVEAAPAEEAPSPAPVGAETVRLDSLDLEEQELTLQAEPETLVAEPAESLSPGEAGEAVEAEGVGPKDVTWGNLDLEAVEEEEAPRSTEVEAPADATPLSEQEAGGVDESEPFRLSDPESGAFSLEPETEAPSAAPSAEAPPAATPPATTPPPERPAPAAPAPEPAAPEESAAAAATGLSDQDVERIARRVAELVGEQAVKEVAWEIVPDLAEVVIRDRIHQLESEVEGAEP
jgi:CheY-like chemotaxis protein